jgi:Leucine-rich repeat (LRR) protein
MPRTVAKIGSYAFAFNNIREVVLPDRITEIGSGMFWNNNLTGITIPEGVTTIGDNAFENNGLTELVLPKSVISIGGKAFSFNHTDVHGAYNDRNKMTRVTIGDNVELDRDAIRYFTSFYNYAVKKKGGTYNYHGYYWMPEDKNIPVYRFDPEYGWKSPDIAFLLDMPDLEDVRLRNNDALTDITPLSELKKIKTLHIDNCPNIQNIQPLAALATLEWLRIDDCPNIQNIQPLASLVALKFLYLMHNNNYDYGDIASLPKLESITIRSDHAYEIDLGTIGQLRYVKHLSLSGTTFKNINELRNLTNLETLDISGADHLDFSWAVHLRNLTKLELNFCSVEDVSPLAKAPNLAEIDLAGSSIKDIAPLLNSNSIKYIRVFDEDVTAGISDNLRFRFEQKGIYLDTFRDTR